MCAPGLCHFAPKQFCCRVFRVGFNCQATRYCEKPDERLRPSVRLSAGRIIVVSMIAFVWTTVKHCVFNASEDCCAVRTYVFVEEHCLTAYYWVAYTFSSKYIDCAAVHGFEFDAYILRVIVVSILD